MESKLAILFNNNNNFIASSSVMDQFEVHSLLSISINSLSLMFTNIGVYLILPLIFVLVFFQYLNNNQTLLSNGWSLTIRAFYATVYNMVKNQIGRKKGLYYFNQLAALINVLLSQKL